MVSTIIFHKQFRLIRKPLIEQNLILIVKNLNQVIAEDTVNLIYVHHIAIISLCIKLDIKNIQIFQVIQISSSPNDIFNFQFYYFVEKPSSRIFVSPVTRELSAEKCSGFSQIISSYRRWDSSELCCFPAFQLFGSSAFNSSSKILILPSGSKYTFVLYMLKNSILSSQFKIRI